MDLDLMRRRAELIRQVRGFFSALDYLEVDTPILAPGVLPEHSIEPFATQLTHPRHGMHNLFLLPSPEIWMKRLLAAGSGSLFQISHCFRNAEQIGRLHHPEFTMLEWYSVGADYMDSAERTEELLEAVTKEGAPQKVHPPCRRMSMAEVFDEAAGIDLVACEEIGRLRDEAIRAGIAAEATLEWETLFNALFLQLVEPALPRDRPLILYDYPSRVMTLAKQIPNSPWCERWELYIDGVEVANCFSEETDPLRVAEFFRHEEARIGEDQADLQSDRGFREIFGRGFPECSGVALGIDRLLMVLVGRRDLGGVIFFPLFDIFDQPR